MNSLQSGGQVVIRPTERQRGSALGTLLASIGLSLAMELGSKLFGKGSLRGQGLSVPTKAGKGSLGGQGLTVSPKPGNDAVSPSPIYWEVGMGRGVKKKSGKGSLRGQGLLLGPNHSSQ